MFSLRSHLRWPLAVFLLASLAVGCAPSAPPPPPAASQPTVPAPVVYNYTIVHSYPHDPTAFTEGLVYWSGNLYESTGLNGQSSLRKVDLPSGKILQQIPLANEFFGEGLAILGNQAYQLTWKNHQVFRYDVSDFKLEKTFSYDPDGWGLTSDGQSLIASDGTNTIRFIDPATFTTQRTIEVTMMGQPVKELNELEYIKGEIYANIWQTNFIVRIDPKTGTIVGVINFGDLLSMNDRTPDADVLNGIAYDVENDRLFITGKKWSKIYEVKLRSLKTSGTRGSN